MTITPEMIVAIGTAIAAVLVSIGTLFVSINNGRMAKEAKSLALKSDNRIEEVHVLVNGKETALKKEIDRLSAIIANLTGAKGDVENAKVAADQAKDSVKLSKDMMDKLPNG